MNKQSQKAKRYKRREENNTPIRCPLCGSKLIRHIDFALCQKNHYFQTSIMVTKYYGMNVYEWILSWPCVREGELVPELED